MIRYILKLLRQLKRHAGDAQRDSADEDMQNLKLSRSLKRNLEDAKKFYGTSSDIVMREFAFGRNYETKAALLFIDGLVDTAVINESIIKPLMYDSQFVRIGDAPTFRAWKK